MEVASGFVAAGFLIPTVHLALEVTETGQENPHGGNPSSVDWVAVSTISQIIPLVTWNMKSFVEHKA